MTADRLTSVTAPGGAVTASTYDANGNQASAGATTCAYDLADRLVRATVGATTETYTWSGDGIRRSAVRGSRAQDQIRFLVDRAFALPQVALERDAAGRLVRRYTYGPERLSQTTSNKGPYWHHADGLGSVTDVTSPSGAALAWTEYGPFGTVRASGATSQAPVTPFGFTGEYRDGPTGLYYPNRRGQPIDTASSASDTRRVQPVDGATVRPVPSDSQLKSLSRVVEGPAL